MKNSHTILIVEDKAINRRILNKFLSETYKIKEASNGKEALDILEKEENKISAILLDLIMPVMDGFEFLEYIKENKENFNIPIVVMTQKGDTATEIKALSLGVMDFLSKPYNSVIIKQRLKNIITIIENASLINKLGKDRLTSFYNKEAFFEEVSKVLKKDEKKNYAILAMNITKFKIINDMFGMEEGDKLLRHIADVMRKKIIGEDVIFSRFVADEFYIMVEKREDFSIILKDIENEIKEYNKNINILISFGIYKLEARDIEINVACDRAKIAADTIKDKYDVLYSFYDEKIANKVLEEYKLSSSMKASLKNQDFKVFLQPKCDLITRKTIGAEALIRWIHPEFGFITPDKFIPLFERNGFITNVDMFVLECVCKKIRKWLDEGVTPVKISVNLSRVDIYNPLLGEMILGIINSYNINPKYISFEVTETAYTENSTQLITAVTELKKLGFTIEMDDFGSGYSSLNMLDELPLDILKLDMKFLENRMETKSRQNIISFVSDLAKLLKLSLVAEGIETEEQLILLRDMGYEYGQGYYFSRPVPQEEFDILLDKQF